MPDPLAGRDPLDDLVSQFAELDWSSPPRAHRDVQAFLARVEDPSALLRSASERRPELTESDRSSEKTTHFKWFIAADSERRFELWLNQYKPAAQRRVGHAEVPHNHRFWFTSLILNGGFTNAIYGVSGPASLDFRRTVTLRSGDTFVTGPDDVHALRNLEENTLTLLVQSRPVRDYSEVYENGEAVRYYDLPSTRRFLNERLTELQPFGSGARQHH